MPPINREDDVNYELVIREKRQDVSTVKVILQKLFSSIGLVFLCVAIAAFGKYYWNPSAISCKYPSFRLLTIIESIEETIILSCVSGATAYIAIEQDFDEGLYEDKQVAAKQVRDAQLYLNAIFWEYATNIDRFNLTEETLVLIFTL